MLPLSVSSLLINGISHKITQQEHFSFRPRIKRILIKQTGGTINGSHHLYYDGFMTPYDSKK